MEPPSKTTCSAALQITVALETRSVMTLDRGGFSAYSI